MTPVTNFWAYLAENPLNSTDTTRLDPTSTDTVTSFARNAQATAVEYSFWLGPGTYNFGGYADDGVTLAYSTDGTRANMTKIGDDWYNNTTGSNTGTGSGGWEADTLVIPDGEQYLIQWRMTDVNVGGGGGFNTGNEVLQINGTPFVFPGAVERSLNDTIDGGEGNDSILGEDGDDILVGGDDNDTILGGDGNDTIEGGATDAGNDSLEGGAGDDIITDTGGGADTIDGGLGNDTIEGGSENDVITGDGGITTLDATYAAGQQLFDEGLNDDAAWTVVGDDDGENEIQSGLNNSLFVFGQTPNSGTDAITPSAGEYVQREIEVGNAESINLNFELDTNANSRTYEYEVTVLDANDNVLTTVPGSVTSTAGATTNFDVQTAGVEGPLQVRFAVTNVTGNQASSFLQLRSVEATVNDIVSFDDSISGDDGDDSIAAEVGNDTVDGGQGNDTIDGGEGADSLVGGSEDDVIDGGAGADTLDGGSGDDDLTGGAGDDSITDTGGGADTVDGGGGNDTISTGAGNDTVQGGEGDDSIDGGSGDDCLIGDPANAALDGKSGEILDPASGVMMERVWTTGNNSITTGSIFRAPDHGGQWAVDEENPLRSNDSERLDPNQVNFVTEFQSQESAQSSWVGVEYTFWLGPGTYDFGGSWADDGVTLAYSVDGTRAGMTKIGDDWFNNTTGSNTGTGSGGWAANQLVIPDGEQYLIQWRMTDVNAGGGGGFQLNEDLLNGTEIFAFEPANSFDDTIDGGDGNDKIEGVYGDDSLIGGAGDDTILGGDGDDTIQGDGTAYEPGETIFSDAQADSGNWTEVESPTDLSIVMGNTFSGGIRSIASFGNVRSGDAATNIDPDDYIFRTVDIGNATSVQFDVTTQGTPGATTHDYTVRIFDADGNQLTPTSPPPPFTAGAASTTNSVTVDTAGVNGPLRVEIATLSSTNDIGFAFGVTGVSATALTVDNTGTFNDTIDGGDGDDFIQGNQGNDTIDGGAGNDSMSGGDDRDIFLNAGAGDTIDGETGSTAGGDVDDYDILDTAHLGVEGTDWRFANVTADETGVGASSSGQIELLSGGTVTGTIYFEEIESFVICFGGDTGILTDMGDVPAAELEVGDLVQTVDDGLQPIRWIGKRRITAPIMELNPKLRPIRICAGALGQGLPEEPVLVSPQHRVLVRGKVAEKMFGEPEVLVPAKMLVPLDGIDIDFDVDEITYVHFLLDDHQIVYAEGAEMESLYTGPQALKMLTPEQREEVLSLFPELVEIDEDNLPYSARLLAPNKKARNMIMRLKRNGKWVLEST